MIQHLATPFPGHFLPTHLLGLTADPSVYSEGDAYMQMCSIVFDH